ncbi:MAG: hypothetical protein KF774_14025 [Planctomyces sp.]|nr:hypothetical protein [Planctomyces sp.]
MSSLTCPTSRGIPVAAKLDELERFDYRPLSMLAAISFVLGLLSATLILFWFALVLPAANLLLLTLAVYQVRTSKGEIGGTGLALWGLALSAAALGGGILYQVYVYQTEIPVGYTRISFTRDVSAKAKRVLQGAPPDELPAELLALDGQNVFLKGFMYPTKQQRGLTEFLLVRDDGCCLFGGKPEMWDMIGVFMSGQATADHDSGRVSVAGTFRLNRQFTGGNELEPAFLLDGHRVTRSRSDFDPPAQPDLPLESPAPVAQGDAKFR